jgi:hypothetical protein
MSDYTSECIKCAQDETKWYEYPASTPKPVTSFTQADIDEIQGRHNLVTFNNALTSSEKKSQWQAIGLEFEPIQKEMFMAEKFENAWHSLDATTYIVSAPLGCEGDLPTGFTRYDFQEGKDRLYSSGLYDPMTRGI